MANEEAVEDRFLKELYGLTDGQATRVVRGEELARRLGMDPEEETATMPGSWGQRGALRRKGS
jgi:hypothetical protein